MPLVGADFEQRSRDEILAFLEAELRAEWGEDIDLTQSSAFRTFAEALSTVDAEDVEPALEEVYSSAFLEEAEEENLDKVVAILGITRRDTIHATGTIRFGHGDTTKQDYGISNGTIVQTDSDNPVEFETTQFVEISFFDDFETGSLESFYGGQTATFSVVDGSVSGDPSPTEGTYELKAGATSGDHIFSTAKKTRVGCTMDFRLYLQDTNATDDAVAANMFGVEDGSNYYRVKLDSGGGHAIEIVTSSGTTTLSSNTYDVPDNQWLRNEIEWSPENNGTIISRIYDGSGNVLDEIKVTGESEIEVGGFGFEQLNANENVYWDHSGERSVMANARAREGGIVGNVGANTLVVMPSIPAGVSSVTNPYPMGDDSHYLTNLFPFDTGIPRETDEELRDRATVSEGARGNATVPALIAEARQLPEAESVSVFENKTNTDNTGSGGLPPKSFELVYYGNDDAQDIADMLHDVRAFTARDYGGAHGTAKSETVEAENGQTFTMDWTEPTDLNVDMTLDIVVNDEYIGDDPLRDRIVDYIGGKRSDGTLALGTGTSEDVYVDQVEDVVTGPDDTGVIGISSYSFTPATTTDSNGLEIVDVGSNEVAKTDATDSSITLNVTTV